MKPLLLATTLTSLFALNACSLFSSEEPQLNDDGTAVAPTSLNAQTKNDRTNSKDLVVYEDLDARRGAAIEQGSDKHFLHKTNENNSPLLSNQVKYNRLDPKAYVNTANSLLNNSLAQSNSNYSKHKEAVLNSFQKGSIKDYSYYELSRWQRFCDGGKNMDRYDWRFVKNRSHVFPSELAEKCNVPSPQIMRKYGFKY